MKSGDNTRIPQDLSLVSHMNSGDVSARDYTFTWCHIYQSKTFFQSEHTKSNENKTPAKQRAIFHPEKVARKVFERTF